MDIQVIDYTSPDAPSAFARSLKETGFAVLTNHPVEDGLIEEVYAEWREFLTCLGEQERDEGPADDEGEGTPDDDAAPSSHSQQRPTPAVSASGSSSDESSGGGAVGGELRFGSPEGAVVGNGAARSSGVDEPMFSRRKHEEARVSEAEGDRASLRDRYLFDPAIHDGYFPMTVSETAKGATVKDLKHYYHCYFPKGRYPAEVSRRAALLHEKTLTLGKELVGWIDDNMSDAARAKLPETMRWTSLADWVSDEQTLLRVLHYPAYRSGTEPPGAVRAAAHEDINTITVLPAGSTRGLQVRCPRSGSWYDVPCIRGSLVVNIGDMLQECTGGEYVSTTHRVVKPEGEGSEGLDRMSTPCFIHFKPETYLSERYPTAEVYLHERLRELGVMK